MRTFFRAKSLAWRTSAATLPAFLALGPLLALPFHGSLYTPVREHQAIGPLPADPVAYYPYEPQQIRRLADLPVDVQFRAIAAVKGRVGDAFYGRLRFVGGEAVNLAELRRVNPDSRKFRAEIPAYALHWDFALPEAGIRNYTATLALRGDGTVLRRLDLPDFAANPDKLRLVPLARIAEDLIRKKRLDPAVATATVTYDGKAEHLVWHFEQPLPGGGAEIRIDAVDVDARTGTIIPRS